MPRYEVGEAIKGSQKWLQRLINEKPDILNREVINYIPGISLSKIIWLSASSPRPGVGVVKVTDPLIS